MRRVIPPIDVGCWMFWKNYSDSQFAVYYCKYCDAKIQTRPENLPAFCPECGRKVR